MHFTLSDRGAGFIDRFLEKGWREQRTGELASLVLRMARRGLYDPRPEAATPKAGDMTLSAVHGDEGATFAVQVMMPGDDGQLTAVAFPWSTMVSAAPMAPNEMLMILSINPPTHAEIARIAAWRERTVERLQAVDLGLMSHGLLEFDGQGISVVEAATPIIADFDNLVESMKPRWQALDSWYDSDAEWDPFERRIMPLVTSRPQDTEMEP